MIDLIKPLYKFSVLSAVLKYSPVQCTVLKYSKYSKYSWDPVCNVLCSSTVSTVEHSAVQ